MAKKRQEEKRITKNKGSYFSKLREVFKATKLDNRYWKTFFVDVVYSAIIGLVFLGIIYMAFPYIKTSFENLDLSALSVEAPEQINEAILSAFFPVLPVILGFISMFLLIRFFLIVGFKGWIWRIIMRKKMSTNFFWRFAAFKILIAAVAVLVLIMAFLTGSFAIFLFAALILLIHLFTVSMIYFVRDAVIFKSIKKGFKEGIKIHLFILPYLFLFLILIVRGILNNLLQTLLVRNQVSFMNLQEVIINLIPYINSIIPYTIISTIIGLFFVAYIRIFYAEFVSRL